MVAIRAGVGEKPEFLRQENLLSENMRPVKSTRARHTVLVSRNMQIGHSEQIDAPFCGRYHLVDNLWEQKYNKRNNRFVVVLCRFC